MDSESIVNLEDDVIEFLVSWSSSPLMLIAVSQAM